LPGREPIGQRGNLSSAELIENTHYLEKDRLFYLTTLEMIQILLFYPFPSPNIKKVRVEMNPALLSSAGRAGYSSFSSIEQL